MSAPPRRGALAAWALYDWAASGYSAVVQTFVFAAYFTRRVAASETEGSAQWGLAVGGAGLAVALAGPLLGALVDRTGRRLPWIAGLTLLCAAATAGLWWVRPDPAFAPLGLALVATATLGAELAYVPYNALLAELAAPERLGRWSGWGWGLGYAGGVACLAVVLVAFVRGGGAWLGLDPESAEPVRAAFPFVAAWLLVFALPLLLLARDAAPRRVGLARAAREGLVQLRASLRAVRRYAPIARFLVARMLYVDGLATLFAFGGVYAAGVFAMSEAEVLGFGIALNLSAGLGAVTFAGLDDRLGPRRTIVLALIGLLVPGALVLLVESKLLFWILGLVLGLFVGPAQASSRSYLAHAAPPRLRNEAFGLYALSGKATAFAGPLAVGGLTALAGSQRVGMVAILVFFAAGLAVMRGVPPADEVRRAVSE